MSAKSIIIKNTKQAIIDGIIKGNFNPDNTIFRFNDIRYKLLSGKISILTLVIELLDNNGNCIPITDEMLEGGKIPDGYKAVIKKESGQEGGKIREAIPTYITKGKHLNAINETNIVTQAFRDALGTYIRTLNRVASNLETDVVEKADASADANKKADASADASADANEKADAGKKADASEKVNGLMPPPMLVQNIKTKNNALSESDFRDGIILQKKLNGVHYITFRDSNSSIVKYSRGGLIYAPTSMPKLNVELDIVFNNILTLNAERYNIPDSDLYKNANPYFAGELYKHGIPLNLISGQARNEHTTIDLEYYIFDVFFPAAIERGHNMESRYRQLYLDDLFSKLTPFKLQYVKRVENFEVHSMDEVNALVQQFLKDNYEGGIVRKNKGEYQYSFNNYHSKNILKIKPTFDDEFPIVGFKQGSKGKDLGALIWVCSLKNNAKITFNVVPNLGLDKRKEIFKELMEGSSGEYVTLINKIKEEGEERPLLTVSYAELSAKGIPLQPKGLNIRERPF
uniref:ATP-dependent DNA ligase family profile domain-containing protein n=1 Tax=viral metagenome TaxID=1070528 RepID=A0A6C0I2I7_9ZZZZ